MADITGIEWCDSTFNPWIGCTKISSACDNCYAAVSTPSRTRKIEWGVGKPRQRTSASNWHLPVKWNSELFVECSGCGWRGVRRKDNSEMRCGDCASEYLLETRRRVFCASLADVFDNEVDPQWRFDLFKLIVDTPNIDWLLLTKRIGNAGQMLKDIACLFDAMLDSNDRYKPLPNLWLGITICNQEEADRDIPKLFSVPANVRFLSIEPMLSEIDLRWCDWCGAFGQHDCYDSGDDGAILDWVICGGESGSKARPMHLEWVRSLRDQCKEAGVPFLFKQWGEYWPVKSCENTCSNQPLALHVSGETEPNLLKIIFDSNRNSPDWIGMCKVGKKKAGRELDGVTHSEFPVEASL